MVYFHSPLCAEGKECVSAGVEGEGGGGREEATESEGIRKGWTLFPMRRYVDVCGRDGEKVKT